MSDLFGNHIVGFPTRRLIFLIFAHIKDCGYISEPSFDGYMYKNVLYHQSRCSFLVYSVRYMSGKIYKIAALL